MNNTNNDIEMMKKELEQNNQNISAEDLIQELQSPPPDQNTKNSYHRIVCDSADFKYRRPIYDSKEDHRRILHFVQENDEDIDNE